MKFDVSVTLPFDNIHAPDEFISLDAVRAIAQAAEQAGFCAGAVTDHPVPSYRWLDGGGHYAQDPFVLLAMIAAVTTKLGLLTGILVLPYRNPFITARSVASLDVFSGARVQLGIGAGYLTPDAAAGMVAWRAETPRDKHDRHEYRATDPGLDMATLHARFAFYSDRFLPSQQAVRGTANSAKQRNA